MRQVFIAIVAGLTTLAGAQFVAYPQRRPPQRSSYEAPKTPPGTAALTEVVRVLSNKAVQTKLDLTSAEIADLGQVAGSLTAATTSEEEAFATVSKTLTATQISQLQGFMVEDLGYGALALSGVRSKLNLTEDETKQIMTLTGIEEAAKRAILRVATNENAGLRAVEHVASLTNAALGKILTSTQDAALHKMASSI